MANEDPYFSTAEYMLNAMPHVFDRLGITFSKTEAMKLVGGKCKLYKLIEQGKIRVEKTTPKQNGKWFCKAGDVIRNMKI